MTADFKSHILRRDEKGFAGIPFKRLLAGGVAGGLAYTLLRLALPDLAIVSGLVVGIGALILTGSQGGLPLWMRLWLRLRGRLLIVKGDLSRELARMLNVPTELAALDGEAVFASPLGVSEIDLREWATFIRAADVDREDGLVFVDAPHIEVTS